MSIQRHFLGWERPALHLAVEFLWNRYQEGDRWDLSRLVVATPGARAGLRLMELLALRTAEGAGGKRVVLTPPRCVTSGFLPEQLYQPALPVAGELETLLARYQALAELPPEVLARVYAAVPETGDISGWLAIAEELEAIHTELAGERISYATVAAHCDSRGLNESAERWRILGEIQTRTEASLGAVSHLDLHGAREAALQAGIFAGELTVILLATVDLPSITVELLRASGCEVHCLVHAPQEEQAGFDETGRIRKEYWQDKTVPIVDEQIEIGEQPRNQAGAVVEFIQRLEGAGPEHVIVGLGDETLGENVQRTLELSGYHARRASRLTLDVSPPGRLLRLLAEFGATRRAPAFAALIRHPDLEHWLRTAIRTTLPPEGLPALWDAYYSHHLQATLTPAGKRPSGVLGQALKAVEGLLAPLNEDRPLEAWPQLFSTLLESVYEGQRYDEDIPQEAVMAHSLVLLGETLRELEEVRLPGAALPVFSFSEAVTLLLSLCAGQPIPEPWGQSAIELLGWLEVPLDDSPALALTGLNEGAIPGSINAAPFLPDRLRRELGLLDNARRYARDAYLLSAVLHSRQQTALICARRGAQNEPLTPSRLLFACDEDAIIRRSLRFYSEEHPTAAGPLLWPHGEVYRLATIPRPLREGEPINELRVTAFRDYLACPYRFYLRHVCGLETVGDGAMELEYGPFGNLIHDVFKAFDDWVMREFGGLPPQDADVMASFLLDQLRSRANERFGEKKLPAVALQLHQMGRRLQAFAVRQAREAAEGWRIIHAEKTLRHGFTLESGPFEIHGRADRIDFHPEKNLYRILDYKSSDKGAGPEETHRVRSNEGIVWRDLQLPLYRKMARSLDIDESRVEVGYITLPRDLGAVDFVMAGWDEQTYQEAYQLADEVMRRVRGRVFWPPADPPPPYVDGFNAICLDGSLDRAAIIAQDKGPMINWPERERQQEAMPHSH